MTIIYYFSGSGNTLAVAKDLSRCLNARLEAMAAHPEGVTLSDAVTSVGFAFPSHDFQAPTFVQSWISRVEGLTGKYLFAVMTYGISAGRGLKKFNALIGDRGGRLSAAFAVMMPHNGIGSRLQPMEIREGLLQDWRNRRDEVAEVINRQDSNRFKTEPFVFGFLRNESWKMLPGLFRFLGVLIRGGEDGLFYEADQGCNACGICARVCPVGNIRMEDNRPVWGNGCLNCFACLHWCPQEATHLSAKDLKINHSYRHPDITTKEMVW